MALQCSFWSDLHTEILELIFDCTKDPIDVLRSGATCKSWLPTALEVYRKFLPLCLIDKDVVFNILTKQTRKIHLPDEARRICCSNNGWLLTVDETDFHSNMHLINIFTRTQILLPPLMSLYGCEIIKYRQLELVNWKIIFVPSTPSDCIIFLFHSLNRYMHDGIRKISTCKTGDIMWTNSGIINPFFRNTNNLVQCNDKIYVSNSNRTSISIFCLPRQPQEKEHVVVNLPVPKPWHENFIDTFVIKPEEDVIFVGCRSRSSDETLDGKLFLVFEFDVLTKQFKEVNDLGGNALFLSSKTANHLLVKTSGWSKPSFKANCIYFFRGHDYEEFGIYDLKTKDIEYVPCQSIIKHANWINLDI